MFWKKKVQEGGEKSSARPLSPAQIVRSEIELLEEGKSLIYQLSKTYWNGLGVYARVELNPRYPKKGKRYDIFVDDMKDEKPAGSKKHLFGSNSPKEIGAWILDKGGVRIKMEQE